MADLAALAEHTRGAAIDSDNVIYLHGDVGIGGGVATACLLLGKAHGLHVIATSRDEHKRLHALQLGADAAVPALAQSTAANGAGSNIALPVGKIFSTGIGYCVVTGIANADNTAVAAATFLINIDWN